MLCWYITRLHSPWKTMLQYYIFDISLLARKRKFITKCHISLYLSKIFVSSDFIQWCLFTKYSSTSVGTKAKNYLIFDNNLLNCETNCPKLKSAFSGANSFILNVVLLIIIIIIIICFPILYSFNNWIRNDRICFYNSYFWMNVK